MTYQEFMTVEKGDGVEYRDPRIGIVTATVTEIREIRKGSDINGLRTSHSVREIEITFLNGDKKEVRWLSVYIDYPNELHNMSVLRKLSIWNPFEI